MNLAEPSVLVVVSYYDRRPTTHLERLLHSLAAHDAGAPYTLAIVANRTSDAPLSLPRPPGSLLYERANTGMNIGAWDHGWRAAPRHDVCLFLQDECFAVRDNWLGAFIDKNRALGGGALIGESFNPAWDKGWNELRRAHAGERMPEHVIDGKPAERVDVYLDFLRRIGVDAGASGRHLRSLVWFAERDVLETLGGFPIGANYGECIAAEIAVSRKAEALGKTLAQVSDEPFRYIRHAEYNRDFPGAPFTHTAHSRGARTPLRAREAAAPAPGADVIFRVASADPRLASTRYRALLPALGLAELGLRAIVTDGEPDASMLRGARAIVFAKAFRPQDLALAHEAKRVGAPIILDLCDHIFVPDYGGGYGALNEAVFRAMAQWAAAIVTTGAAMAEMLAPLAPAQTPIVVIPDQVETPELAAQLLANGAPARTPGWRDRAAFAVRDPGAAMRRAAERFGIAPAGGPAARPPGLKRVLWFGNHGAEHSQFGMLSLKSVLPHLETAARHTPLELRIVSNSREKFAREFSALPFPSSYADWSLQGVFGEIAAADVCVLPNAGDEFSRTKSANRVALSLAQGAPVIAGDFPALADFRECIVVDDWAGGLRRYLGDPEARDADVAKGRAIIAASYSAQSIAKRWADLLDTMAGARS